MTLRDEIKTRMAKVEMSQSELARQAGVQQPAISRYLAGRQLTSDTLDKLLDVLGIKRMAWH